MASIRVILLFLSTILCFYLLQALIRFLHKVWWSPIRLQAKMNSQGIRGPPYRFLHGNAKEYSYMKSKSTEKPMDISHDIHPKIQPHVYAWTKIYGNIFVAWHGSQCQFFVREVKLIKEILMNKVGAFPKIDMEGFLKKHLGDTIATNEGEKWAKIRKLANHTFHAETLKGMVPAMISSVSVMLERWKDYQGKEIDVFKEFELLSSDVISRTAFGSSYVEGKHIYDMMMKSRMITFRNMYKVKVPGISMLLKSDDDVEADELQERIRSSIQEIIKKREKMRGDGESEDFGSDYLGQLIRISQEHDVRKGITLEEMINEIKAIYDGGHQPLTSLLSWCILLLAMNTEWQEKAREEVNTTFRGNIPDSEGISRLKIMKMIINESLRLYPPVNTLVRKVKKEAKLGDNISLPPKMNIHIPVLALHHDPKIWGDDAHLFRPERFAEGVAKATNNNTAAFLPFGLGPRTCSGVHFVDIDAKITLSMILQKYKFSLSPNYAHNPSQVFYLIPKSGVQVILNTI